MNNLQEWYSIPVLVIAAFVGGVFTLGGIFLTYLFLYKKTGAETKNLLSTAIKQTIEVEKIKAETETAELANEEKRTAISSRQISELLTTATNQSKQIQELLEERTKQTFEMNRLIGLVNAAEAEKQRLNAIITYQQEQIERMQKNWGESIFLLNQSRERENALVDKFSEVLRHSRRLETLLSENNIDGFPILQHSELPENSPKIDSKRIPKPQPPPANLD